MLVLLRVCCVELFTFRGQISDRFESKKVLQLLLKGSVEGGGGGVTNTGSQFLTFVFQAIVIDGYTPVLSANCIVTRCTDGNVIN